MSLATMLTRTATISRKTQTGPEDDYNMPTWVATSTSAPCYLEPASESEDLAGRQVQTVSVWAVFLPGVALGPNDTVTVDGIEYEVVGEPERWHTPVGEHHVEVGLRRVTG